MTEPVAYGASGLSDVVLLTALITALPKPMIAHFENIPDGITLAVDMLPVLQRLAIEFEDEEAEAIFVRILAGEPLPEQFPSRYASHLLDVVRTTSAYKERFVSEVCAHG